MPSTQAHRDMGKANEVSLTYPSPISTPAVTIPRFHLWVAEELGSCASTGLRPPRQLSLAELTSSERHQGQEGKERDLALSCFYLCVFIRIATIKAC